MKKEERFVLEKHEDKYFDEHMYFFDYDGIVRKKLISYKFNDKPYIYEAFVNFCSKNENFLEILKTYDIIIPVPISSKRMKQRGYNQSYLFANKLCKCSKNLKLVNNVLYKSKNITEQSKLNKEQRIENIKNAYVMQNYEILNNKNILIIDDIYTTGSTVNECSRILKNANTNKIGIFTIAKDQIK